MLGHSIRALAPHIHFSLIANLGLCMCVCVCVQSEHDLPGGLTYTFSFRHARPTWLGWGEAVKEEAREDRCQGDKVHQCRLTVIHSP